MDMFCLAGEFVGEFSTYCLFLVKRKPLGFCDCNDSCICNEGLGSLNTVSFVPRQVKGRRGFCRMCMIL
ncbi:hypothetical protein SLEP1_g34469 [Rubroshorea leprosula]|uniref:Uncharacterized protein n=1 Tax=Rubroshorea leprosula TaxID=152421 RepID=A0AAV5KK07_9ROSI|nr:hypothetical protein SLEP1_g34469 [Rubroshorea leprosula]